MPRPSLVMRLLWREMVAGSLTALLLATMVAVAAITGVAFLVERVEAGLRQQANEMIGGDLLIAADHPLPPMFQRQAQARGLRVATSALFPSMVRAGEHSRLAEIKAVSGDYPLRGRLYGFVSAEGEETLGAPQSGSLWLDGGLAATLGLGVGDRLAVGEAEFIVAGILTREPDRSLNPFAIAPRVMLALADLPATGLVQPGSRIVWRLHLAGEEPAIREFRRWAEPLLARGERLEGMEDARPEIRLLFERAQRFLRLASLLSVVLAAVAIGLAARRFAASHIDGFAVLRAYGANARQLIGLFVGMFLAGGMAAALVGGAVGFLVHLALLTRLFPLFETDLPAAGARPLLLGLTVALVLLAGFALPPLLRLRQVPAVYVLRREWPAVTAPSLFTWLAGAAALFALLASFAGETRLAFHVAAGFAAALLGFALAARLLLAVYSVLAENLRGVWRLGFANLCRRKGATVTQLVAMALGCGVLILLFIARGDLLASWQARLPPDAPNRFVINIQPHQREGIAEHFRAHGVPLPEFAPMVRGRLLAIAGKAVRPDAYPDPRAQRLAEREFNLSMRSSLPPDNRIVAGRWFAPATQEVEFSVELGLAKTLGMQLGDVLAFAIAGRTLEGRITSLRKVDWDSMRVNFFVIAPPGSLDDQPMSYITSFHLPEGQATLLDSLVARFPNLTVIDVAALAAQVETTLERVAGVVGMVFAFALLAGLIVLAVAVQASLAERQAELALLVALGARRAQIRRVLLVEFAALGLAIAFLAVTAAAALATGLARQVLDLDYWPAPLPFSLAAVAIFLGVTLLGLLLTRRAYRRAVGVTLREG